MLTKEAGELKSPKFSDGSRNQSFYEQLACQYANWFHHWIEASALPAPESLLDVGCRTGTSTLNFMQAVPSAEIIGIDIEPEFVAEARERGAMVLEQDVQTVDELGRMFDYGFVSQVLEHVRDPVKAIKALHKCVRHGMFVGVPIEDKTSFDANSSHLVNMGEWEWLGLFQEDWLLRNLWYDKRIDYLNFAVVKKEVR